MTNYQLINDEINTKISIPNWRLVIGFSFVILICLLDLSVFAASTSLDPTQLGIGARSLSMGRSGAADMCEMGTIYINPANTGCFKDWGVTSMQTSLMQSDINYTFLAGAKRFADDGVLAVAYLAGSSFGINSTTIDANSRVVLNGSSFDYSNATFILSYGKEMKENFRLGGLLKTVNKNLSGQGSASGFNFDIGMTFVPKENLVLGLVAQNLMPSGLSWGTGAKENLPIGLKTGISFQPKDNLLLNLDLDSSPGAIHTGIEWQLNKNLSLRAGAESATALNYSMGVGIEMQGFRFDYAYLLDGNLAENSTSYFSLSFAPEVKEPEMVPHENDGGKKLQLKTDEGFPKEVLTPSIIISPPSLLNGQVAPKKKNSVKIKKIAPKKVLKKKQFSQLSRKKHKRV
ncbi:MAG: PorV/PorQ family protein [Candidatus Margulisiibacteriota bacterium]